MKLRIAKKIMHYKPNGGQISVLTARIVKWNKKNVWLSCDESEIRFPWSSIIKIE